MKDDFDKNYYIDPDKEHIEVDYEEEDEFYYSLVNSDGWITYEDPNDYPDMAEKVHSMKTWTTAEQIYQTQGDVSNDNLANMIDYTPGMVFFKKNPDLVISATKLDVFNDEECDELIEFFNTGPREYHKTENRWIGERDKLIESMKSHNDTKNMNIVDSTVEYDENGDKRTWRNSDIQWLNSYKYGYEWVFERMDKLIQEVNEKYFKISLSIPSVQEPIQLTKYKPGGVYEWHTDWSATPSYQNRKLSYVIQLSDSSDYQGCNLQFQSSRDDWMNNASRKRGSVTFFPSTLRHRASVLTEGERYSGVGWVQGDVWR